MICGNAVLAVVGSPNPRSFCHVMARRAAHGFTNRGLAVSTRDLYEESFDPVAKSGEAVTVARTPRQHGGDALVEEHRQLLTGAELLVVAHPNWWGKPPAIMAGWLDRVFSPGVAYLLSARDEAPTPLLKLRGLLVLTTGDTPPEREQAVFGDPLDAIWRRCVGAYLPKAVVERVHASPLGTATEADRERWLDDVDRAAARLAGTPVPAGDQTTGLAESATTNRERKQRPW